MCLRLPCLATADKCTGLLDPALFGPHAPDLDGSSPVGLTDCGSEDDISSVTDTLRSPEPGQHLVTPEPRVASFGSGRSESFGWDAYSLSDLMDPGLDPCGSYAGLDVDDALELDDYLNLPPSQPCSQSYDTVLPSIEPHSTTVTTPPGPATLVDGDPVQGS